MSMAPASEFASGQRRTSTDGRAAGDDDRMARGWWLDRDLIVWPQCGMLPPRTLDWTLHVAPDGGVDVTAPEPVDWPTLMLHADPAGVPADLLRRYPHLDGSLALRLPSGTDPASLVRNQVLVTAHARNGRLAASGGVQIGPLLDLLYPDAVHADLGPRWHGGVPSLAVWAPTARSVDLLLWPAGTRLGREPRRLPMNLDAAGVWSIVGEPGWEDARYLFTVTVFSPEFGRVVENRVTDPYAVALTMNSTHAVLADLDADRHRPPLWRDTPSPVLRHPVDQVLYELHVRDFSAWDATLPERVRGTCAAFTHDTAGARHLKRLAEAGLTSVELLPITDGATVEEDPAHRVRPDRAALAAADPDSTDQQEAVLAADRDYNWGYDPWHQFAPEGGLVSTDAVDGGARVAQVRDMIGALHSWGLRVVLDQVFNHTHGVGQAPTSVLDRIVPGYYHRRDLDGQVSHSTCCPTVATEHAMARRLMVDAVRHWARAYRVDGFRIDLMGHHDRATKLAVRDGLDALTLDADGVDGRSITLHGEGWDFGEVAGNARFVQATMGQLGGTRIAAFSDRLRDAVRGGGPFDSDPRLQGFGTGLAGAAPEGFPAGSEQERAQRLANLTDLVQLGLAGNLRAFAWTSTASGRQVRGDQVRYGGAPAGWADEPADVVSYVDAHDNETLFDALVWKLPRTASMAERVRANTLCLAVVTLGQSPVMWHAGTDLLRSKSLDRNSYRSGDWFNRLDFSMRDNGFGVGLPPGPDNAERWPLMAPLLRDPALRPSTADIRAAHAAALDLLRIRASSPLFRLGGADQVLAKVTFPLSGSWAALPGVVAMLLDDRAGTPVDPRWDAVLVAFNAQAWPVRQQIPGLMAGGWTLHPTHVAGSDPTVRSARCDDGVVSLPGWTCAVFVKPKSSRD